VDLAILLGKNRQVIQLLDGLRRDRPQVQDRVDQQADQMAQQPAEQVIPQAGGGRTISALDPAKLVEDPDMHENRAYALLEQQDRDIAHAAPNQNGNDILRHDLARGVWGFDDSGSASFVSYAAFPRAQKARHIPSRVPWAWLRDIFIANAADRSAEPSLAR
jgi:hypothetical protein